jgi:ribokinase
MARVLVLGSSNTDFTVRLPSLPARGQTMLGGSLTTGPGGKGANQAVAAARAGGEVAFLVAVGDDAFGRESLDRLEAEGIDVSIARVVAGVPSGVALIFVDDDGENMIAVAPGANFSLGAEDIDALPSDLFHAGHVLLIAGLEIALETVARAIRRAAEAGMRIVLNPAPVQLDLVDAVALSLVEVITPNRVELAQLSGISTADADSIEEAAAVLSRRGPQGIVVTLGSQGCHVHSDAGSQRIPSHSVRAIDTVGAGDAFSGALAVALAEGRSLVEAARWANAAAALAVTLPGAQSAMPIRAEIDRLASFPIRHA